MIFLSAPVVDFFFFAFSYLNPGCVLAFCGCEKDAGDLKNSLEVGTRMALSTLWFFFGSFSKKLKEDI